MRLRGTLSLGVILTWVQGQSCESARPFITKFNQKCSIVAIEATGQQGRFFCQCTGMAEILLLTASKDIHTNPAGCCLYINLFRGPGNPLEAYSLAQGVENIPTEVNASPLSFTTKEDAGIYVRTSSKQSGCVISGNDELGFLMVAQTDSGPPRMEFPRQSTSFPLNLAPVAEKGDMGLIHRYNSVADGHRAFNIRQLQPLRESSPVGT